MNQQADPVPERPRRHGLILLGSATKGKAAYEHIRASIIDGTLAPGSTINQDALANGLGISVIPVREALRRLQGEGLVTVTRGKSVVVAELSARELREVRVVRLKLDPLAAELAAAAPREERAQLKQLAKLPPVDDQPEWQVAHRAFHQAIWDLSGNLILIELLERLWDRRTRYQGIAYPRPYIERAEGLGHEEIARAVLSGNGQLAANLTAAHLTAMFDAEVQEAEAEMLGESGADRLAASGPQ